MTQILPRCLLFCLQNNWCLQWLKFSPVACNLAIFWNMAKELVVSMIHISPRCLPVACYLLAFQARQNNCWLQRFKISPVACNLVVFCNVAKELVASVTSIFLRCLLFCCLSNIAKYCKITGGFNDWKFPPLTAILLYFTHCKITGDFNDLDFPLACNLYLKQCKMTGGFNDFNFPTLPAILLYFETLQNKWWLQWLKFSPVACNLAIFWNMAKELVVSMIHISPRCLPVACYLLLFQTWQNNWWLQRFKFSHVACYLVVFWNTAK